MARDPPAKANIWIAAGDGDLARVQDLIEAGESPNAADENSYTPMHAAASYAHLHVLDYLISKGGDVNITDDDNETPLFVVETVQVARYLVEKGAIVDWQNNDNQTPADSVEEDFPEISAYLRNISSQSNAPLSAESSSTISAPRPSQYTTDQAAEQLTSGLMSQVRNIMESAERDGRDPQEELQRAVEETFVASARVGQGMGQPSVDDAEDDATKRARLDPSG